MKKALLKVCAAALALSIVVAAAGCSCGGGGEGTSREDDSVGVKYPETVIVDEETPL